MKDDASFCPDCMGWTPHDTAKTETVTAFLCGRCGRVEEWQRDGTILIREKKQETQ